MMIATYVFLGTWVLANFLWSRANKKVTVALKEWNDVIEKTTAMMDEISVMQDQRSAAITQREERLWSALGGKPPRENMN